MARAQAGAVVWDRPQLRALCPPDALAYDAPDVVLSTAGSRFHLGGDRGRAPRARRPQRDQRRRRPDRGRAGRRRAGGRGRGAGRLPRRPAAIRAARAHGRRSARYDDYAHHPTEVAAAIAAARTLEPGRLVAVFQPHLFSRTRSLAREFGAALAQADISAVLASTRRGSGPRTFRALMGGSSPRRPPMPGADAGWRGCRVRRRRQLPAATLRDGDLCLMMGAGDIDALGRSLVA